MITIRKSGERGHANHGWLDSYHTFSFADYFDCAHMNFGVLRVINEDRIQGGTGFGTHGHKDMEIITYIVEGALEHQDSMGHKETILPGEVQRMSAGTGVTHSEYNKLADQTTHLLQIWILPDKKDHTPSYGQKSFVNELTQKDFILVACRDGRENTVSMNQDVDMYVGRIKNDWQLRFEIKHAHMVWVQMIKGKMELNQSTLLPGDGAAITDETFIQMSASKKSEFIVFDIAAQRN